jgi:hypothetical protein
MFWLFFWFAITFRGLENSIKAVIAGQARWIAVIAFLVSLPVGWYVCSVPIHYLNDRYFGMFSSQLYYTVTELYCILVMICHVDKGAPTLGNRWREARNVCLTLSAGISLSHIVQLGMDEPFFIGSTMYLTIRNIAIGGSDILNYYAALLLLSGKGRFFLSRPVFFRIVAIATANLVMFQLLFADVASFKFL